MLVLRFSVTYRWFWHLFHFFYFKDQLWSFFLTYHYIKLYYMNIFWILYGWKPFPYANTTGKNKPTIQITRCAYNDYLPCFTLLNILVWRHTHSFRFIVYNRNRTYDCIHKSLLYESVLIYQQICIWVIFKKCYFLDFF